MSTSENAKLQYESGQNATAMTLLTDSGDHITFESAASPALWSRKSGSAPVVRPNGLLTGGAVIPDASAVNDVVDVAALTCYLAGVLTSVGAGELTISRGITTDICMITSLTVTSGGALAAVAGTDSTAFSETRGAAGGPPFIAVGSIEIGQVRVSSVTAAVVTQAEIYQAPGTHQERSDLYEINYGPVIVGGIETKQGGSVTLLSALPLSHTGSVAKRIYASYSSPIFSDVALASDFVPAETSHSVSSVQVYGATLGSSASSLGQGAFTVYLTDGISDPLLKLKNELLWFKFYSDRTQTPYTLTNGKFGITRAFSPSAENTAACTISAAKASTDHDS